MGSLTHGEIVRLDHAFGFVRESGSPGRDVFFGRSNCPAWFQLEVGRNVVFEITPDPKHPGKSMAVNVRLAA